MRMYVADQLFKQLMSINWLQPAGMPRSTCFMSDCQCPYGYSRHSIDATPWHEPLRDIVRNIARALNLNLQNMKICANLNLYEGSLQSVDWHSDNEPMFGPEPTILSISLGGSRNFCVRPLNNLSNVLTYRLDHGDVSIMSGTLQQTHQHKVPKEWYHDSSVRINITARIIKQCMCGGTPVSCRWRTPFIPQAVS